MSSAWVARPALNKTAHLRRMASRENMFSTAKVLDGQHTTKYRPTPFGGKDVNTTSASPKARKPSLGSHPKEPPKATLQTKSALKRRPGVTTASYLPKARRVEFRTKVEKQRVPESTTKSDTSKLDLNSLKQALDYKPSPPAGVVDIDQNATLFWSPEYAADIVTYLQSMEKLQKLPKNHLDNATLNSKVHAVLVDWLIQVQEHLHLQQQTLHMCVALLHRFVYMQPDIPLAKIQLVGVSTLLIAAKFYERFAPNIDDLVHLTDNTYTRKEVMKMERHILRVLKFDVHICLATDFIDRFLKVTPVKDQRERELANYFLDLSLTDLACTTTVPSQLAASAVTIAKGVFNNGQNQGDQCFEKALNYYSGWTSADLHPVKQRLVHLLAGVEKTKYKAAFDKYKKEKRQEVSQLSQLSNLASLKLAAGLSSTRTTTSLQTCRTHTQTGLQSGAKITTAV